MKQEKMFLYVAVLAVLYYVYTQREHLTAGQDKDASLGIGIGGIVMALLFIGFIVWAFNEVYKWW
jgi:hypothetical protein